MSVLLLMLVGTLAGLGIGLLPGIGSIVAMSLLLPFTFHMSSFEAFALLLSLYAVVTTAGDLTSILIGIPAHPECAAMILDGYPMARKGQAGRAMAASTYAAVVGAVIGAIALAISVPIMRPIVLHINAGELFTLAILGVVMVGAVSGDSPLQGAVLGGVGLLLAAVGPDVQTGIIRYGFDSTYLIGGVPLIPLAVGLFAVPQLFEIHARRRETLGKTTSLADVGRRTGLQDTLRHWTLVLRGSLIGVLTGIAPGLGSSLGQWVAYGQAMQTSKHPERFGRGTVEGVIAPGASNNSKEGGSLIPTLAFGVPGSGAMAVLLGAFLILGLTPGPSMLEDHLNITFFMILILVVSNILGAALCLTFLRPLAAITKLRGGLIIPFVMFLVFVGAAATTGQFGDLVVMLVAGLIAWILGRYHWPIIPVILGYVLGKSAEPNLFIAQRAYGWAFLERPIVLVIIAIAAATFIWSVRLRRRQRALRPDADTNGTGTRTGAATWASLVISVCLTAVALVAVLVAQGWSRDAKLYPTIVGVATTGFGLLCVLECVRAQIRYARGRRDPAPAEAAPTGAGPAAEQSDAAGAGLVDGARPIGGGLTGGGLTDGGLVDGGRTGGAGSRAAGSGRTAGAVLVDAGPEVELDEVERVATPKLRSEIWMLGWLVATFIATRLVGIGVAGMAFAIVYLVFAAKAKLRIAVPCAVVIGVLFYYVFVHVLKVVLPPTFLHLAVLGFNLT
ncbi:tripartite tricarboxylate transporter permease [Rugosimonospora africana]|nr:tripartite tricarboxylate transporter permease [Rugosimonospora africana]